jgi:hypothetical protein
MTINKLTSILLVILAWNTATGQLIISTENQITKSNQLLLGYNGRSTEGPSWENTEFIDLVHDMNPDVVRYPAGTQANYWDWHTGNFIEGSGKDAKFIYTIEMLTNGLPDHTEIVYVVNMARPTPSTGIELEASEDILTSMETLEAKIADMINALKHFESLGRLPYAIELGNEFYFDKEHATIYAANPELYLEHSEIIVNRIKAFYPDMKIALITTKGGTSGRDYWNNAVFDFLSMNTNFASKIDAVVQHHYINDKFGDNTIIFDNSSAQQAISEGFLYTTEHLVDYNLVPDQIPIWLTEYGVTKDNADDTWATGLRAVAMSMGWIGMGNKIEMLLYHHITTDLEIINKDIMKLGSIGVAMKWLTFAAKDKRIVQQLNFSNNPFDSNGIKELHGFRFTYDSLESTFILNIGSNTFSQANLDYQNPENTCKLHQFYNTEPYTTNTYDGNNILEYSSEIQNNFTIEPFSITIIEGALTEPVGFSKSTTKDFKIYPNPTTNGFCIDWEEPHPSGNIYIYNTAGSMVYQSLFNQNQLFIDPNLESGMYFVKIDVCDQVIKLFIK